MARLIFAVCFFLLPAVFCAEDIINTIHFSDDGVPKLNVGDPEKGYHGLVKENETLVEVTPPIKASGADICSYKIVNKHHSDTPFEIISLKNGEAELRARRNLNCEKRRNYKFDIAAVSCGGKYSDNATVHINVVDINEYAPTFLESSYVRPVDEGRLYEEIIRVEANDRDCTPKFGDICKYEILNSDQPFIIDNEGTIRNTEPLSYEKSHSYVLSVVAYDCGMKQSSPVTVTVKVNRICKLGWKGIPERVDYAPDSGRELLFPNAQLKLCDVPCNIKTVHATVKLSTSHIGKGCDRDTYSVQNQRKLCGASSESVDLLPSQESSSQMEWTRSVNTDEGHESDQMFEFDGVSSAIAIPNHYLDHGLSSVFTIATWMKHKPLPNQDKHEKEHIICSADDHKMSRHHYAWFVRNCRLILLLRRDFSQGELNIFRPAEWRWKIPQVCDDQWHHYAVSVEFPNVQLYIDGVLLKNEKKNPEVIDDWPLHPTADINTTLTVGACWQGSENRMKHHFRGYLAGLSVLLHKTEKPEVLSCLHKCKESLEVPEMELLEPGMELLSNNELTMISVEGDNKTNLEVLVKNIGYTNNREYPTPGRRNLQLTTSVLCDNGHPIKVPSVESYIMVLQAETPSITLSGSSNVGREYQDFRDGVPVFSDLIVSVDRAGKISEREGRLDSCILSIYPSLNPDHEALVVPEITLQQFGVIGRVSKDGATLMGSEVARNYQQLLREIKYTNQKPAYYLNRVFKLICSEMNGRFLSNEYIQTLTVIHPSAPTTEALTTVSESEDTTDANESDDERVPYLHHLPPIPPLNTLRDIHHVESKSAREFVSPYVDSSFENASAFSAGSSAVIVVVITCMAFLLVVISLGWARIAAAHKRATAEEIQDAEMAWDDSALNITVNPMERLGCEEAKVSVGQDIVVQNEDEDDSSDEDNDDYDCGTSENDDDDDDDDDEDGASVPMKGDLEWDNSTLAI